MAYLSGKSCGQAVGMYNEDDVGALRALVEESEIFDIFLSYPINSSFNEVVLFLNFF